MVSVTDDDSIFSHTGSLQFVDRERIEARWRATSSGIRLKFTSPTWCGSRVRSYGCAALARRVEVAVLGRWSAKVVAARPGDPAVRW
jgi:hypothetical protein